MVTWSRFVGRAAVAAAGCAAELLAPERCVVCGRDRAGGRWCRSRAGPAPGLWPWHAPCLCRDCQASWDGEPCRGTVGAWPLWTATVESAVLVAVVGAWKYRGVRGLARPLAALLDGPLEACGARQGRALVVPVPLHPRRRRERGFDQCRQLVRLAAGEGVPRPVADVLVRRRATAQQASFASDDRQRQQNTAGAFAARPPAPEEPRGIVLVDDLATTGATLAAAALAAQDAGWQIAGLVALGQAARLLDRGRG